ncbi:MAG: trimeric intracellular cation channel family protein [Oscillospiraceae bacterium]|nr:trimeric intracellular cation channel family protein [Oscillospiraceae bacterium]
MELHELFLYIAELIGTASFAVSGSLIAIERELDAFGVLFLAVITALGGGILRDVLLGSLPPVFFTSYEFLVIAAISALIVFIICYIRHGAKKADPVAGMIMNIFDAIGLGVFAVVGTQAAITAGYEANAFMCIFMGMTTGIGGGILRDMMSRATPAILRKQIYATAAIIGSAIYYLLERFAVHTAISVSVSVGVVILIRILAATLRWTLPRVKNEDIK